jgi:hypothetical protein
MDTHPIIHRSSQVHEPTPDTPYHAKRRDRMRTRPTKYGVPKFFMREATPPELCSRCDKDLSGQKNFIRINGEAVCSGCLNASN